MLRSPKWIVGLVGSVAPSLMSTKYTAAPGVDGVGPPLVCAWARSDTTAASSTCPDSMVARPILNFMLPSCVPAPILILTRRAPSSPAAPQRKFGGDLTSEFRPRQALKKRMANSEWRIEGSYGLPAIRRPLFGIRYSLVLEVVVGAGASTLRGGAALEELRRVLALTRLTRLARCAFGRVAADLRL